MALRRADIPSSWPQQYTDTCPQTLTQNTPAWRASYIFFPAPPCCCAQPLCWQPLMSCRTALAPPPAGPQTCVVRVVCVVAQLAVLRAPCGPQLAATQPHGVVDAAGNLAALGHEGQLGHQGQVLHALAPLHAARAQLAVLVQPEGVAVARGGHHNRVVAGGGGPHHLFAAQAGHKGWVVAVDGISQTQLAFLRAGQAGRQGGEGGGRVAEDEVAVGDGVQWRGACLRLPKGR